VARVLDPVEVSAAVVLEGALLEVAAADADADVRIPVNR
jgi:hypothetical protein